MVQSGALGQIEKVHAYVGAPPRPFDLPVQPVPADLNWDLWQGSLPNAVPFNNELDPPITVDPDKDEDTWGNGAGTKALVVASQPTGALTCSILHNGDWEWIKMARLKFRLLQTEPSICNSNMPMA